MKTETQPKTKKNSIPVTFAALNRYFMISSDF